VLVWFAGMSLVLVWAVFRSPALDYRLVALGAVLPSFEGVVAGRPLVLHTLSGAVLGLVIVMAATRRHRLARRRWLGLPIGLFVHLVLDGVWSDTRLFWWPLTGWRFPPSDPAELARSPLLTVAMELAGAVALVWWWRRWSLAEPDRRREFLHTGRVGRDLIVEP
jgi:hypothetical protein